MKGTYILVLLVVFCCSTSSGQLFASGDPFGLKAVLDNVSKIRSNLDRDIGQLNQQIRENVRGYLSQVDAVQEDLGKKMGIDIPTLMGPTRSSALLLTGTGGNPGTSRAIYSGYTPEGKPYYRDSEHKVVDGILHHIERVYDPETGKVKEYKYDLDLKDPNSKPKIVN